MSPTTKKWLGRVGLSTLVLALLASGYGLYRLDGERKMLRKEVESLTVRSELLMKKYNEQKALTEAMLRAKQEVESRLRAAAADLETAEKEKKQAEEALAGLETKMNEMRDSYDQVIKQHEERFEALRTNFEHLVEESNRVIREKNEQIVSLTNTRDSLDASLKQETMRHKVCREHNGRFAVLAEELVRQYENKGVITSLGQIEPFTQLKKVEVEKLCQEYRDKIDEATLPKK